VHPSFLNLPNSKTFSIAILKKATLNASTFCNFFTNYDIQQTLMGKNG